MQDSRNGFPIKTFGNDKELKSSLPLLFLRRELKAKDEIAASLPASPKGYAGINRSSQ
jgi:hypothetical protein